MNQRKLYQWVRKTSKGWKGFSRYFQANVAHFTRGIARCRKSCIREIAGCVEGDRNSQRRRLQRFISQEIEMVAFFAVWTQSIIRAAVGRQREVVLVVDETKLKTTFGVMVVGLVYHERCIPLAWRVYRANDASEYPSEGQVGLILKLLQAIQAGMPRSKRVRVLADRGIGTSPALMRGIIAMGWFFLFRVTRNSKIILPSGQVVTFYDQVNQPGQTYAASGRVFKKRGRLSAHVRVLWAKHAQDRWSLVTNDPQLTGWEYAQRMWLEEAFRDLKSHGWQVEQAHFTCPQRLERFWIFLVVAYAWLLLWGHALEQASLTTPLRRLADGSRIRRWSLFREGWAAFLAYQPSP